MSKRATKQGQQYKKNRKATSQQGTAKKKEGLSTASKVAIGVFAVLMALSMSGVLSMCSNFAASSTTPTAVTASTIEELDESYAAITEPLESKLASDATDMATTLQLAQAYMNWGYNVGRLATVDAETSHANELLAKAGALYDAYIESGSDETGQAKVDRALCLLYSGDTGNALSALKTVVEEHPDNAIAWANLGLVNEIQGSTDDARTAYSKAIECDPDDAQGAKSYASTRLLALNGSDSEGLPSTLRDLSGTGV